MSHERLEKIIADARHNSEETIRIVRGSAGEPTADLLIASERLDKEGVRKALSEGADPNHRDARAETALSKALSYSSHKDKDTIDIVKMLLDNGADVHHKNMYQQTGVMIMAQRKNWEIADFLISHETFSLQDVPFTANHIGHGTLGKEDVMILREKVASFITTKLKFCNEPEKFAQKIANDIRNIVNHANGKLSKDGADVLMRITKALNEYGKNVDVNIDDAVAR